MAQAGSTAGRLWRGGSCRGLPPRSDGCDRSRGCENPIACPRGVFWQFDSGQHRAGFSGSFFARFDVPDDQVGWGDVVGSGYVDAEVPLFGEWRFAGTAFAARPAGFAFAYDVNRVFSERGFERNRE